MTTNSTAEWPLDRYRYVQRLVGVLEKYPFYANNPVHLNENPDGSSVWVIRGCQISLKDTDLSAGLTETGFIHQDGNRARLSNYSHKLLSDSNLVLECHKDPHHGIHTHRPGRETSVDEDVEHLCCPDDVNLQLDLVSGYTFLRVAQHYSSARGEHPLDPDHADKYNKILSDCWKHVRWSQDT